MCANRTSDSYSLGIDDILCDIFIFGNNNLMNQYSNSFDTWLKNKTLNSEFVHYTHLNN
jgi:hypothetical protein